MQSPPRFILLGAEILSSILSCHHFGNVRNIDAEYLRRLRLGQTTEADQITVRLFHWHH
jgi:hypothetical protein